MELRIFLRHWNDFSAETEFGIVLEDICRNEIGILLYEEKREEELDIESFCPKKQNGERELELK